LAINGAEPEGTLASELGLGPESRAFLVILRDERSPIESSPMSSPYAKSLNERAIAIRAKGRTIVNFRIVSTRRGPMVLGYLTSDPISLPTYTYLHSRKLFAKAMNRVQYAV
jgi:phage terminase small subunit